jgi:hypothetical protein
MDTRTGWWFRLAISSSVRENSVMILVGALFLSLVSSFPSLLDEEEELLKDGGRLPLLSRVRLLVVVGMIVCVVVLASSSSIT